MNLKEIKTTVKGLENFAFETITSATASVIAYGSDKYINDFAKPGLYCVNIGPRGIVEHVKLVGPSADSLNIPTLDELVASNPDFFEDEDGEEGLAVTKLYFEEFYMIFEDSEHPGILNFAFTEDEFDYYFLVG